MTTLNRMRNLGTAPRPDTESAPPALFPDSLARQTPDAEKALQDEAHRIAAIIQTQADIASAGADDVDAVMQLIVDRTRAVTESPSASIALIEGEEIVYRWVSGDARTNVGLRVPLSRSVGGLSVKSGDVVFCDDCAEDTRPEMATLREKGRRSVVAVTLHNNGTAMGILMIHANVPGAFHETHVHTLRTMAGFVAAAMRNATDNEAGALLLAGRTGALEAFRESEERFRGLYENSTIGMYRTSPAGQILMGNPALASMLGYASPRELSSKLQLHGGRGYHATARSRKAFLKQIEREGSVHGFETVWTRRDGAPIQIRESATAVKDLQGRTVFYEGAVEDVTEARVAEAALREGEARLRLLAENSTDIISRHSLDGRYLYVSPAVEAVLGYSPEELIGEQAIDYLHPDDVEVLQAAYHRLMHSEDRLRITFRSRKKDGGYTWVESSWHLVSNNTSARGTTEIQAATRDVSQRVEAEGALRRSEERFRALIENNTDLMLLLSAEGDIVYAAPRIRSMLGYHVDHCVGKSCFGWVHADDLEEVCAVFYEIVAHPVTVLTTRARIRHRDASWRYVEITGNNLLHTPGVNGVTLLIRDITERHEAETTIRENEARFRGAFDEAPIGMALQSLDGRYTRVNAALCGITGYSEAELLTMSFLDITHPDDIPRDNAFLSDFRGDKQFTHHTEKRYRRSDGTWAWVSTTVSAVRAADGSPQYFVAQVQDIGEARAAREALAESEFRFRNLWDMSADGIRLMDADGVVLMVNDAFCQLIGRSSDEIVGGSFMEMYEKEYRTINDGVLQDRIRTGTIQPRMEREVVLWDGRRIFLEVSNSVLESSGHRPLILSSFRDSTEKKRQQDALQRYQVLAENANDIMLFVRMDGAIMEANGAAARAYGYSREDLNKLTVHDIREPGTDDPFAQMEKQSFDPILFNSVHRRKDGATFPVEVSVQSTMVGDESILLCVIRDATERKAFAEQLAHQAFHDPLTELPNRALFLDRLKHALTSATRRRDTVAVLFLDLDRFKVVNDTLGHQAGDRLLVSIAGRLRASIRGSDTASRFGGDEFTILLEGIANEGEAVRTAERILRRLQSPFEIDGHEVFASGSIGIAVSAGHGDSADNLLREADAAMYQAKSTGKARYALYQRDTPTTGLERLQLETDLRRAIERSEFKVYYQPIVLMESRRTIGVEALVRWQHPRFGLMQPDEFVPLQEQIGLMEPFTLWVLKEAQTQCMAWRQMGICLSMSVNLSVHNLHEEGFAERVCAMLLETGMMASSLKLEITESAVMMNPPRAMSTLNDLAKMGVRLSIDDFGTGYSSLTYLKQMPVHEIKIDKSFVRGMDTNDDDDAAIVRATIDLAHNLRKEVVAEGVETESVWNALKTLGCDAAQGFYMARPMPVDELNHWLRTSPFGLGPDPAG